MVDLKKLEKEINEWTMQNTSKYCKTCEDTCCNGYKHRIYVSELELEPFVERGVPIVKSEGLNHHMFSIKDKLYTKDKKEIHRPSLVQTSKACSVEFGNDIINFENVYALYVDKYCPLYSKENGCEIHEDPRRPKLCKEYPILMILDSNHLEFKRSCRPLNKRDIRGDFIRKFLLKRTKINNS